MDKTNYSLRSGILLDVRIGIYSPYLDTAGGGEKYMLTIAQTLSAKEQVDVFLDKHLDKLGWEVIKERIQSLHNLNLDDVNFIRAPLGKSSSFWQRLLFLQKYDWFFYLTDGSIFLSTAKNSIIHFQVPFENTDSLGLWGNVKLSSWKYTIYNSFFTKQIVEKSWRVKGKVIYPPVDINAFHPGLKKKQILSVGRFFSYHRPKKQDLMIKVFIELLKENKLEGWSLHLAGGTSEGDKSFLDELKQSGQGYPVKFYPNISFEDLVKLYSQSSIYWHAMGFDEKDPKKMEHFGITTVEAMAACCVPIVINKGGQIEIVEEGKSGFLWNTIKEWKDITLELSEDDKLRGDIGKNAQARVKLFSKEQFEENLKKLVYGSS